MGYLTKKDKISKLICDIDEKTKRDLKVKCSQQGLTIREVLEYLVLEYLAENIKIKGK